MRKLLVLFLVSLAGYSCSPSGGAPAEPSTIARVKIVADTSMTLLERTSVSAVSQNVSDALEFVWSTTSDGQLQHAASATSLIYYEPGDKLLRCEAYKQGTQEVVAADSVIVHVAESPSTLSLDGLYRSKHVEVSFFGEHERIDKDFSIPQIEPSPIRIGGWLGAVWLNRRVQRSDITSTGGSSYPMTEHREIVLAQVNAASQVLDSFRFQYVDRTDQTWHNFRNTRETFEGEGFWFLYQSGDTTVFGAGGSDKRFNVEHEYSDFTEDNPVRQRSRRYSGTSWNSSIIPYAIIRFVP